MWYGKHHMKISNRQHILLPSLNPLLTVGTLALWTMPIAARVVTNSLMIALEVIAFVDMTAQVCRAAMLNGIKHTQVLL